MKIGFAGTLIGLTQLQRDAFIDTIRGLDVTEFHHGDCIGADDDAHHIIRLIVPDCEITIHPPSNDLHRAFCESDVDFHPDEYLSRYENILYFTDILIVCANESPLGVRRTKSHDPWRVLQYAEDIKRHTIIIETDGKIKERFSGKRKSKHK